MAALKFQFGHDNRVTQALAIPLASEAFRRVSADQRPDVQLSLTSGYKIWGNIGFDQSLCLPFEKAAVSITQRIRLLLADPAADNDGQETKYSPARYAPTTWYCCKCHNSYSLETPRCVVCDHIQCHNCNVE